MATSRASLAIRRCEIENFILGLSPYEIRAAKTLLEKYTFQFDVVANFPVEIVQLIVLFLRPPDLIRSQQVSKRWFGIFSSPKLIEFYLFSRHGIRDKLDGATLPAMKPAARLEEIHAHYTGRPFSKRFAALEAIDTTTTFQMAYSDGILAWIGRGRRSFYIRRMNSDESEFIATPNREELIGITVADSIVWVLTTNGRCYAYESSTIHWTTQLLSAGMPSFAAKGKIIALVHYSDALTFLLTVWNLSTQKSKTFSIRKKGKDDDSNSITVNPTEGAIMILEYSRPKMKRGPKWTKVITRIFATRYSFDGVLEWEDSIEFATHTFFFDRSVYPSDRKGNYTIWTDAGSGRVDDVDDPSYQVNHVTLNSQNIKLQKIKLASCIRKSWEESWEGGTGYENGIRGLRIWDNVGYALDLERNLSVIDMCSGTVRSLSPPRIPLFEDEDYLWYDDKYLIRAGETHFKVWHFVKKATPAPATASVSASSTGWDPVLSINNSCGA